MGKVFTQKEISRILNKASELQVLKDLRGDTSGLNEQELIALADEVGIDEDTLKKAILLSEYEESNDTFNWFSAQSSIQTSFIADGEISDEIWEEVVREIRRETGGIGALNKVGRSFEWEQRKKDIGYKHLSFTPAKGTTKIQYVNSWKGIKFLLNFFFGMFAFVFAAIAIDNSSIQDGMAFLFATLAAVGGLGLSRFPLKFMYEDQVKKSDRLMKNISRVIEELSNERAAENDAHIHFDDTNEQENSTSGQHNRIRH